MTLKTEFGRARSFGDLRLLGLVYGLLQAWVYAVMFGRFCFSECISW